MSASAPPHSRAFETFVQDSDDLVGHLAYALYKQAVRERAATGLPVLPSAERRPIDSEIRAYRGDAGRRLQAFADTAIEEARPDILHEGVSAAMVRAEAAIRDEIVRRTSLRAAIAANVIAWLITLAATVLIVFTFYVPNFQADLVARLRAPLGSAAPEAQTR